MNEVKNKQNFNEESTQSNNNIEIYNRENEIHNKKEDKIIIDNNDYFKVPYSNYNKYNRDYLPKNKTKERFKNLDPFLKNFNPKFLKKENIDKKIFRKFRNFIKEKFQNSNEIIFNYNKIFWKDFCTNNLLPPMKYINQNREFIEFKSFNTKYFLWFFNQYGTIELFEKFREEEGEKIINSFIIEYNLIESNEQNIIEKLKEYLIQIPKIYCDLNKKRENISLDYSDLADTYLGTKDFEDNDPASNLFKINFDIKCGKIFKDDYRNEFNNEYDYNNFNFNYFQRVDNLVMNMSIDSLEVVE